MSNKVAPRASPSVPAVLSEQQLDAVQQKIVRHVTKAVDIIDDALKGRMDDENGVDVMKFKAAERMLKFIPLVQAIKGNTFNLFFGTPRPKKATTVEVSTVEKEPKGADEPPRPDKLQ